MRPKVFQQNVLLGEKTGEGTIRIEIEKMPFEDQTIKRGGVAEYLGKIG